MANKHEVTVNGQKLKRVSLNRKYEYAVVSSAPAHAANPERFWAQWAGSLELAGKAAARLRKQGYYEYVEIVPVGGEIKLEPKFRNEIEVPEWGFKSFRPAEFEYAAAVVIRYGDDRDPHVNSWHLRYSAAQESAGRLTAGGFKAEHVAVVEVKK